MADGEMEAAKLMIKGMLSEEPIKKALADSALAELRSALDRKQKEIRPIVAFLLLAEYAKELGL